jgi:hypothetical protein
MKRRINGLAQLGRPQERIYFIFLSCKTVIIQLYACQVPSPGRKSTAAPILLRGRFFLVFFFFYPPSQHRLHLHLNLNISLDPFIYFRVFFCSSQIPHARFWRAAVGLFQHRAACEAVAGKEKEEIQVPRDGDYSVLCSLAFELYF